MDKTLKFGVVGVGYFGRHYVRLLNQIEGVKLLAVSRISSQYKTEILQYLADDTKIYAESQELFQDPEIDCVVIAAPTFAHFSLAKAALDRGKHVLVEKAMTATLREAKELRAVVEKSGCTFMVGHQYLYNDYPRYLKNEIDKGTFGNIRYIFGEHLYPGPIRNDVGCFWETATHELAMIDYLFSPRGIREVKGKMISFSDVGRPDFHRKSGFGGFGDDFASIWIEFNGAPSAQITVSWMYPEKIRRMTIVGEKGSAVFNEQSDEKLKIYSFKIPPNPPLIRREMRGDLEVRLPKIESREPLRNELEHFIGCVRSGKAPLTDIEHGMRITGYLDAVYQALNV